ncbi:histidine phosphatase family protein [Paenibacillus faecalis]|uniref:histidine phosphatase family protein n=1 Tax=Paenibacillus faecalis TaxID=2079532 RepID=UPI000D0F517C|nr:histidine phosphatase family protein [Paenibacillus faecalis]
MKTYLYFVRHGIAPFSLELERSGSGASLNEQGRDDAQRVAELLLDEGIDVIVSSPYNRAKETVAPLAHLLQKDILLYNELIERPIGSLNEAVSDEELLVGIEQSFRDIDFCMPEGETTRQAQERTIPIMKKLLAEHKGKKIALGTHGNIMTIIMNYFDAKYGFEFWKGTSKPDIYKLEFVDTELTHVERLWNPA